MSREQREYVKPGVLSDKRDEPGGERERETKRVCNGFFSNPVSESALFGRGSCFPAVKVFCHPEQEQERRTREIGGESHQPFNNLHKFNFVLLDFVNLVR